mmetsp:Transcript_9428/g.22694  ORF Transcript_9428/g.22694 Transcript_9428/m.22694 type:complete len:233 (+) Transcript_9428:131-829(+)
MAKAVVVPARQVLHRFGRSGYESAEVHQGGGRYSQVPCRPLSQALLAAGGRVPFGSWQKHAPWTRPGGSRQASQGGSGPQASVGTRHQRACCSHPWARPAPDSQAPPVQLVPAQPAQPHRCTHLAAAGRRRPLGWTWAEASVASAVSVPHLRCWQSLPPPAPRRATGLQGRGGGSTCQRPPRRIPEPCLLDKSSNAALEAAAVPTGVLWHRRATPMSLLAMPGCQHMAPPCT